MPFPTSKSPCEGYCKGDFYLLIHTIKGSLCSYCYKVMGRPRLFTPPEVAEANLAAQWSRAKKKGLRHNKRSNSYGQSD